MSDLSGDASADDTNTCYSRNLDSISRSKGGRPMGATKEKKRIESEEVMKDKNKITARMRKAKSKAKQNNNKQVKQGLLTEVIADVKKKKKIKHHHIPAKTIKQRQYRQKDKIHHCTDHKSPLLFIEDTVVKLIIKLSRFVSA